MSSDKNDERKIEEAKEKLGCKIEPPGKSGDSHATDHVSDRGAGATCDGGQSEIDFASEKVRLTQMTTAGG